MTRKDARQQASTLTALGLRIIILCCTLYLLSYFLRNCVAVIATDIQSTLGFTESNISLISGSTMLAYGLMQLPAGALADAFGGRKVITALLALAALGCVGLGLSPWASAAVGSRFMVGVGAAIYIPAITLLASHLPSNMYSRALGLMNASGGIGGLLATVPMTALSQTLGWRGAVFASALLTVAIALIFFMGTRDIAVPNHSAERFKPTLKNILNGIALVIWDRRFWPLCIWQMTVIGLSFMMITLWWFPYLVESAGLSKMQASTILSIGTLPLLLVPPIAAWFSDVVFKARRWPLLALSFCCLGAVLMWVLLPGMGFGLHAFQALLFVVCASGGAVLNFTIVKETFPVRLVGTASGCVNMIYPIWAAVLQVLFGLIISFRLAKGADIQSAYSFAFLLAVANISVAIFCAFLMKETFGKEQRS